MEYYALQLVNALSKTLSLSVSLASPAGKQYEWLSETTFYYTLYLLLIVSLINCFVGNVIDIRMVN